MKPSIQLVISSIGATALVMVGLSLYQAASRAPTPRQEAGQAPPRENSTAPSSPHPAPTQTTPFVPAAQQGVTSSQADVDLEIDTGKQAPHFEQERLDVKAGQIVSLTFRNNSEIGHRHSWVLVRPGLSQEVATEATSAGPESEYVPDLPDAIIARTRLLDPGQSQTIAFRAPAEPGDYPYICTFPGHWQAMKGTLRVH